MLSSNVYSLLYSTSSKSGLSIDHAKERPKILYSQKFSVKTIYAPVLMNWNSKIMDYRFVVDDLLLTEPETRNITFLSWCHKQQSHQFRRFVCATFHIANAKSSSQID